MFAIQGFVHAADRAELPAHGAGVIVLRGTIGTDRFGGFRVQGAFPLLFPVQGPAGVAHFVVDFPGAPDAFGNVRSVGGDFAGDDALFHVL